MKKMLTVLAAVIFTAGLLLAAGCGKNDGDKKLLRLATDANFPPYESYENGKIVGIDIDIVREIAKNIGCEVEIVDMKIDAVLLSVEKDRCDIGAATLTITEEREKCVDFSIPYATATQIVIVPENSSITKPEELKNAKIRVGVQQGSASDSFFTREFGIPDRFGSVELAVDALVSGKIHAVSCDNEPANVFLAKYPGKLRILPFGLTEKKYAFAFPKNNPALRKKFDAELEKMKNSGRLQEIVDSYLKK